MQLRSILPLTTLVLLSVACSGGSGGGGGIPQLNAAVDLSGNWTVSLRPTSVAGNCGNMVAGSSIPGVTQLAHSVATGELTIDANDPQTATTGLMDGATFSHEETATANNGDTTTSTLNLTFSSDGSRVHGNGRERTLDAGGTLVCDFAFDVDGDRADGALAFLLEWDTDDDVDLQVTDPDGVQIYWGNQNPPSPNNGHHSGDANDDCSDNLISVEAVTYDTPQPGPFTAKAYESIWTFCNNPVMQVAVTIFEPGGSAPTVVFGSVTSSSAFEHQVIIP